MPNVIVMRHDPAGLAVGLGGILGAGAGMQQARESKFQMELAAEEDRRRTERHQGLVGRLDLENELLAKKLAYFDLDRTMEFEERGRRMRQTDRDLDLEDRWLDIREQQLSGTAGPDAGALGPDMARQLGIPEELAVQLQGLPPEEARRYMQLYVASESEKRRAEEVMGLGQALAGYTQQPVGPDGQQQGAEGAERVELFTPEESAELLQAVQDGQVSPREARAQVETRLNAHAEETTRVTRHQMMEQWAQAHVQTLDSYSIEFEDAMKVLAKWTARRNDPDADPEVFRDQFLMAAYPDSFSRAFTRAATELQVYQAAASPPASHGLPFDTGGGSVPPSSFPGSTAPPAPSASQPGGPSRAPVLSGMPPPEGVPPAGPGGAPSSFQVGRIVRGVADQVVTDDLNAAQAAELLSQALGRKVSPKEAEKLLLADYPDEPSPEERRATSREGLQRAQAQYPGAL